MPKKFILIRTEGSVMSRIDDFEDEAGAFSVMKTLVYNEFLKSYKSEDAEYMGRIHTIMDGLDLNSSFKDEYFEISGGSARVGVMRGPVSYDILEVSLPEKKYALLRAEIIPDNDEKIKQSCAGLYATGQLACKAMREDVIRALQAFGVSCKAKDKNALETADIETLFGIYDGSAYIDRNEACVAVSERHVAWQVIKLP